MSAFDESTLRELERPKRGVSAKEASKQEPLARAAEREQAAQRIEPQRRFTDKPEVNPGAVRGLASDHPAMRENRTLFPSTVVEVTEDEPARLLVSGANNRKLGDVVAKGRFKGYALYGLSLEERATCPPDCAIRDACYGNGMQMARRHRIGDPEIFYDRLGAEIADLLSDDDREGLLIRLHVLGDFPSVDYVANWADLLDEWEGLACYGYTAHKPASEIGAAIESVKARFPDRFRIRWSNSDRGDGSLVLDKQPDGPKFGDAIVCPAQTDATACCATCGLCWEQSTSPIAFIKHGPKSGDAQAQTETQSAAPMATLKQDAGAPVRKVQAATTIKATPAQRSSVGVPPIVRAVDPAELRVEGAYQRDLSNKSIKLLRKIVAGWDWAKFKPPICAEREHGLVVIDGQHTAIAAATLGIKAMPVMVVSAGDIEKRADSFVAHNRDRIDMSPFQIFHAQVVAGESAAVAIMALAEKTGAIIPRNPPQRGRAKPGMIAAIKDVQLCYKKDGAAVLERAFRIAVAAGAAPLTRLPTRALRILLTQSYFAETAAMPDSRIANGLKSIVHVFEDRARFRAANEDQPADRIGALMIAEACALPKEDAA